MNSYKTDFDPESDSGRIEEIDDESMSEQQIHERDNSGSRDEYDDDDDDDLLIDDTGVVVEDNGDENNNNDKWISGKSVREMEEDLLNYDSDNDMDVQEDENLSNIRQVANELLQKPVSKVVINYNSDRFLLFDYKKDKNLNNRDDVDSNNADTSYHVICSDNQVNSQPSNVLMATIRQFLEGYYGKLKFTTKEIVLNIPSLDITLFEDNVYNNQVTFEDIQTIFRILKSRSEQNNEAHIPEFLTGNIELRTRFVARYNTLVELTESSATLQNIRPFSNDKSHPLILDDNTVDVQETVVMNIDDEEKEDRMEETKENEIVQAEEVEKDEKAEIGNVDLSKKGLDNQENMVGNNQGSDSEHIDSSSRSNVGYSISNHKDNDDDDDLLEIVSDIE